METTTPETSESPPPPTRSTPRLAPGDLLSARFQIVEHLGRNAFAELYRALDTAPPTVEVADSIQTRPVLVRLLHASLLDEGVRVRLEQQTLVAGQLEHKNIASTVGLFTDGGSTFVVGELVDGQALREMLDKKLATGRAFSLKGAYNVVAHVCNALGHAHASLVHGALTCDSVMVNAAGRVKIADFGMVGLLARLDDSQVSDGRVWGSIAPEMWAAPEQADRRADVYSVGAILCELLTGRSVATGQTRPSQTVPSLPPALDDVIERALRTSPAERYGDVQELKQAIHAAVEKQLGQANSQAAPAVTPPPPATVKPPRPPAASPPPPPPASAAQRRPSPPAGSPAGPPPRPPQGPPGARPTPAATPAAGQPRPGRPAPQRYTSTLIAVEEQHERWLIQKDKLDFGPYVLSDVKAQIEKGQIVGEHTIVDMENGEKRRVKDHPLLRDVVRLAEGRLDAEKALADDAAHARSTRNRLLYVMMVLLAILVFGGGGLAVHLYTRPTRENIVYRDRDKSETEDLLKLLKGIEITMKVDPPVPKATKKHSGGHKAGGAKNQNGEFSDVTTLGDATEDGGDETLSQDIVQKVMTQNFGVLKGCVLEEKRRNPSLKNVDMDFVIKGTGTVAAVKVNGNSNTPFSSCMFAKMQSVAFPKFNGSKTHASFSLALK